MFDNVSAPDTVDSDGSVTEARLPLFDNVSAPDTVDSDGSVTSLTLVALPSLSSTSSPATTRNAGNDTVVGWMSRKSPRTTCNDGNDTLCPVRDVVPCR